MNNIVSSCNDPGLIPILAAVRKMLTLMQIIGPILAIIMLSIHLAALISNPDNKKAMPKIRNSAIALVALFLIPTIVNAVFALLGDTTSFSSCWNSAVTNNNGGGSTYVTPYPTKSSSPIPGRYNNP